MPLYNKLPEGIQEVDVIIAGGKSFLHSCLRLTFPTNLAKIGGTAACIVAARLSAASPALSILLIELGKNNYNEESIVHPALYSENYNPAKKHAIFYKGEKSDALAGREPIVPSGGILGGGSSINVMMYVSFYIIDLYWNI
jgi:alcohol oxidase